jgi:hypothetical protein
MRFCWGFAVSAARALPNHGGLTPPALGCRSHVAERCSIFPARRSCYLTTGGLRPPLLVVHAFVHRKSRHFTGTRSRIQTGAAGVSPPWCTETHLQGRYRKRAGDCRRWAGERRRNHGRPTTGGLRPPLLLYMRLCIAKVAISPAHVRACKQERRVSARRGVRKRICNGDTANVRETGAGVPANVVAIAVAQPRGANAPRSCVARMRFCWGFAVCATRALPGHGGSRPQLLVVGRMSLNGGRSIRHTVRVTEPRGLTPPALGCRCVCASRKSPFHRQTFAHSNRSGGREPAVVCGNASARAIPQRCGRPSQVCQRTSLQSRSRNHGGLTPPALGCTCVCALRKSPFRRHTFAPANRSGGREPAVDLGSATVMATPHTRSATDSRAAKERRACMFQVLPSKQGIRRNRYRSHAARLAERSCLAELSCAKLDHPHVRRSAKPPLKLAIGQIGKWSFCGTELENALRRLPRHFVCSGQMVFLRHRVKQASANGKNQSAAKRNSRVCERLAVPRVHPRVNHCLRRTARSGCCRASG